MPPPDAKDGSVDEVVPVADIGHRRGQHQDAVDLLYRKARDDKPQNIVPLVMDLAHLSPGQGRAGPGVSDRPLITAGVCDGRALVAAPCFGLYNPNNTQRPLPLCRPSDFSVKP